MRRPKSHKWLSQRGSNTLKARWIREIEGQYGIVVLQELESSSELDDAEIFWIAIGRAAGTLTNVTDGGEGLRGYVHTDEHRQKQSKTMKGRKCSPETRARMSVAAKNRSKDHLEKIARALTGKTATEETKARLRDSARRRGNCMSAEAIERLRQRVTGRRLSEETKEKIGAASRARADQLRLNMKLNHPMRTEAAKEKMRIYGRQRVFTEATRVKMRAAKLGKKRKPHTSETKEKIRIAALARRGLL